MTILTCSVSECIEPKHPKAGKGMCMKHYRHWRGLNAPRCSVAECELPAHSKSMCSKHVTRFNRHGSASDDVLVRGKNEGNCTIEGCDSPMRSIGLCATHATQKRRLGEARPFQHKWSERGNCKVCGEPCTERGKRQFCSSRCQVLHGRHGGVPPVVKACERCGDDIDMFTPRKGGVRKRSMKLTMCDTCFRGSKTRHKMSVSVLAKRDGTDCTICGEGIDMSLRYPDMQRASVDHVLPYSLGGTHDPENLALAHLVCNIRKSNRAGWTIMV